MDALTLFFVILLALAIFVLIALPLLTIGARSDAQKRLPALKNEIEAAHRKWRDADQKAEKYRPHFNDDAYREAGGRLSKNLTEWQNDLKGYDQETQAIERQTPILPAHPVEAILHSVFLWPWRWLSIAAQIRRVSRQLQETQGERSETANDLLKRLAKQHTDLLKEILEYQAHVETAAKALQALQAAKVQGNELPPASQEQQNLSQLLAGAKRQLDTSSQPQVVVEVRQKLGNDKLQSRSATLKKQTDGWKTSYDQARDAVSILKSALPRLQTAVQNVPDVLDEADLVSQARRANSEADALSKRFAAPVLGDLGAIQKQATDLCATIATLAETLEGNHRDFERLSRELGKLMTSADQVRTEFRQATLLDPYPIQWDVSQPGVEQTLKAIQPLTGLYGIDLQAKSASPGVKPTPQQVKQDLLQLPKWSQALASFAAIRERSVASRRELLDIVNRRQAILEPLWILSVQQFALQSARYSSANWREMRTPQSLEQEAGQLCTLYSSLLPTQSKTLNESDLAGRLASAKTLEAGVEKLESSLDQAQARWEEMRRQEQQARNLLAETRNAFARLDADTGFEQLPGDFARQISGQLDQTARLLNSLEAIGEGAVRGKYDQVVRWNQQLVGLAQELASSLEAEISRRREQLRSESEQVKEILAPLTLEPASQKVKSILGNVAPAARVLPKSAALSELTARLEVMASTYREIGAAQANFAKVVLQPLQALLQKAHTARKEARDARDEALALIPKNRDWPPISATTEAMTKTAEEAEKRWQKCVSGSGLTVLAMEAGLKEAARLYEQTLQQVQSFMAQVEADQEQFQDLEEEMNVLEKRWRDLRSQYALGDVKAARQIADLLGKVERAKSNARYAYKARQRDYASIYDEFADFVQQMNELAVGVNSAQRVGTLTVRGFQVAPILKSAPQAQPPRTKAPTRAEFRERLEGVIAQLEPYRQYDEYVPEAIKELKAAMERAKRSYPDITELRRYLNSAESILSRIPSPPEAVVLIAEEVTDLAEMVSQVY